MASRIDLKAARIAGGPVGTYDRGVHRLTRKVRFAINAREDRQLWGGPGNSYGGFPPLTGAGQFFELAVTLEGALQGAGDYLLNIKDIDGRVRQRIIPLFAEKIRGGIFSSGIGTLAQTYEILNSAWPDVELVELKLILTPFYYLSICRSELPMIRLSQKFEFCASHRLHNPGMSNEENRRVFGKCNNPLGHGHNYELQVTLIGRPDEDGQLIRPEEFEAIVSDTVIEKFDHKNLNAELAEFKEKNPSVENIAEVIYHLLKPRFGGGASLASVVVWETPKTCCEYAER